MKQHNRITFVAALLLFYVSITAAWPWPSVAENVWDGILVARQEERPNSASSTAKPESAAATSSAAQSSDDGDSAATTAAASASGTSASASASGSDRASSGSGSRNATRTTAIDPRLPPGGISMITPAVTDGMTFVKVGEQVTFKWNYTSLSVKPSYVDVVATNTINSQTYTIAANQSFEPTQAVTWDTHKFSESNTLPFVVATYTLMIYDADSNPTTIPSAGYLGAFSNLQFGVYTPQAYVPLNQFRCATCSGASSLERQALGVLLGTCLLTILSFTWFANGFGVFS